ncbi:MAG: hypothetical protein ACI9NN_001519 [Bacteroidia bacterium]|jgi:hypothetical protein
MNTSALILMITVQVLVTVITGYLFYKVLTTPPNPEPDSYSDNDDVER